MVHFSEQGRDQRERRLPDRVISVLAMTIQESRYAKDTSQGSTTFSYETKIEYNFKRLLPTAIDEYTTEDQHAGLISGISRTTYQTTLTLVSDSMAKQ